MRLAAVARTRPLVFDAASVRRAVLAAAAVVAVAALLAPALASPPAPLTSDESLYLAEGYNIAAGKGPRYASGELVNHRAPLFPALLAVPIKATGEADSAYWVSKLTVVALVGATFLLARQLFGAAAGIVAALLVSANAFLRSLGATLFLDGVETLFLLLFMWACWRALESRTALWWGIASVAFAAAFLAKESAVQWLPLPLVFVLLSAEHRRRDAAAGLAVFYGVTGAALGGWWTWVYAVTGRVYFWGEVDARLAIWLALASAAGVAAGGVWMATARFAPSRLAALARFAGISVAAASAGVIFYHLEFRGAWPFPHDYIRSVPRYLWQAVAPNTQPWPLVLAAVLWAPASATRNRACRLLALALVLYLPFAVLVANRWLQIRDWLPMTYVGYVAAGGLAAAIFRWADERGALWPAGALGAVCFTVFAAGQTGALLSEQRERDLSVVSQNNWDNPLARDTAAWIGENVPAGAVIMASRLYHSHLYVLDEGRHPVHQLPTVRVEPRPGEAPFLRPMSTMFRWEEHRMRAPEPGEPWLYVVRYPVKTYFIALSERDLLQEIADRRVDYLVLAGEDAGYSSLSYLDYFVDNPAFTLVHRDERSPGNAVYVFQVDRARLAPRPYRAQTNAETLDALAKQTGSSVADVERAIDADGVAVSRERGGADAADAMEAEWGEPGAE